ncbi:MAG: molybdenum cofactor guanylyltransferase [Phycisphaerales bacterium]|nr:molybdenum cofactor guanylyltransferase [Phycisphaerales bacterium]
MGTAKALLRHPRGCSFAQNAMAVAREVTAEVVLLGEMISSDAHGTPVIPDAAPAAGPLGGLCSLLEYAAPRYALLLACDLPFLRPALLWKLLAQASPEVDAVAYCRNGAPATYHTCCALYSPTVLPAVKDRLARRALRMQDLLGSLSVAGLAPTATENLQLTNVNSPAELHRCYEHWHTARDSD